MPKVTYICVDCGKEKIAYPSYFKKFKAGEYRCRKCANIKTNKDPDHIEKCNEALNLFYNTDEGKEIGKKALEKRSKNHISKKVTYTCIDCGKKRTGYPKEFDKPREEYRCDSCAKKLRRKRVVYKCADCGKEKSCCPSYINNFKDGIYRCKSCSTKKRYKDPAYRENHSIKMKQVCSTPQWKEKASKIMKEKFDDPVYRKNNIDSIMERSNSPQFKEKCRQNSIKNWEDPVYREKALMGLQRALNDPTVKQKSTDSLKERWQEDYSFVEKQLISKTGQSPWYGHPTLIKKNNGRNVTQYCEKWNVDLWDRIDAAWDYKSAISGKDRFENYKYEHLCRHHVYDQPKACCVWDEDSGGYYAWINNGSKRYPQWIKYYIKGDPNKFVLLTRSEHKMIDGSKKTRKDKIWWIKFFENLIEQREKQGKKCYLTPEEYDIYKVEHADIIKKYKIKISKEDINTNKTY